MPVHVQGSPDTTNISPEGQFQRNGYRQGTYWLNKNSVGSSLICMLN